jgi:hypothetical protein
MVVVNHCDAADAEMRELQEGNRAGSTHAHNCDMEGSESLLTCMAKSETLPIKPVKFLGGPVRLREDVHGASDYSSFKFSFLSRLGPHSAGS